MSRTGLPACQAAGIILAAGESSRMGRDKALLPYAGSTFVEHLLSLYLPRVSPVVVVLGHHADEIRSRLGERSGLRFAINTAYRSGQLSSLQAGIRALHPETAAALVTLVDHPGVAGETLDRLLASPGPLVIPVYRGRRGHPVLFSRPLLDELLALPADGSAKAVVRSHLAEAVQLEVEDPGVLGDVDTPEDYEGLLSAGDGSAPPAAGRRASPAVPAGKD